MKQVDETLDTLMKKATAVAAPAVAKDWEVCVTRLVGPTRVLWQFSAKLHPSGRDPRGGDWFTLGWMVQHVAEAIGAPPRIEPVPENSNPHGIHRYEWSKELPS